MSTKTYREFVVPYNSRILKAFGGGCVHYCGNATHHADSFLAMEGLEGAQYLQPVQHPLGRRAAEEAAGRIALFVCDFTPVEYEAYFDEMLDAPCPTAGSSSARSTRRWSGC